MRKLLKISIWAAVVVVLMIASTGAILMYMWSSNLPYIGSLREYNPPIITEVYSDDGEVVGGLSFLWINCRNT